MISGITSTRAGKYRELMGGIGSGRRGGSGRNTVESCRSLDINKLQRSGCLEPGWAGAWQWTRDGQQIACINLRAEVDRLHHSYRVRVAGGAWQDVVFGSARAA